jgi:hypothetical protein
MSLNTRFFLLLIAVIFLMWLLRRGRNNDIVTTTTKTTTTVHIDTLRVRDTVYFPLPYRVVERCIDTLYIDTSRVIREYFTEKHYHISYQDTLLQATADIKVAENSIELARFDYEVYRPTIHTTTIITEKSIQRFFFAMGGGFNYNILNNKAGIEFLATIGMKRQNIYIGYDFINQTPRMGWQYRIK